MCADDGKTYFNECQMKQTACREDKELIKLHDGRCKPRKLLY